MTTRPVTPLTDSKEIVRFPDAPPEEMTAYYSVHFPGHAPSLAEHFGNQGSTVIISEIAAGLFATASREGILYPDLLVAFNADPEAVVARNGYLIPEHGKPPDFVLEVASESTSENDETYKRTRYAAMGVPEYWRFDRTGDYYESPLAGDRLEDGAYVPIPIHQTDDEHLWGHSEALNLVLCWEEGHLRFWEPVSRDYLDTFAEKSARAAAERQARLEAEARADAAEACARRLEEELRRRSL